MNAEDPLLILYRQAEYAATTLLDYHLRDGGAEAR